jgi:hypothetical protein
MATSGKFRPLGDADFCDIHSKLLDLDPMLEIIVIGPRPTEAYWKSWAAKTSNRMRAVGPQLETHCYMRAADIYLDSYPFGSLTSLLEAGLSGLPCASWQKLQSDAHAGTLTCDDIALDALPYHYFNQGEYLNYVISMLNNRGLSRQCGKETRDSIQKYHCSDWWLQRLNQCYAQALENFSKGHGPGLAVPAGPVSDQDRVWASIQSDGRVKVLLNNNLYSKSASINNSSARFAEDPWSETLVYIEKYAPEWVVKLLKKIKHTISF